jgi:hypothetical protein
MFTAGFVFFWITSFSQIIPINEPDYNKPKLFQGLPYTISVSLSNLNSLFDFQPGQPVSINLSDVSSFRFEGAIISNTGKYGNRIRSVVIGSSNYSGASLTISKVTAENGDVIYRGRILSLQHGDLYDLQNLNGRYTLIKKNLYDLVNE